MFLATVIFFLSCIEITSLSSNFVRPVFSLIKHTHDGSVVQTDYKLVQFQPPAANMVKLYSFNPLCTMITSMFQEKSNMYHISEPIIRRFFPKPCATLFHLRAVFSDSFSFAMKRCNTSQGFLAPFFVQSCDRFLFRLNFFSHFSRSFLIFFKYW